MALQRIPSPLYLKIQIVDLRGISIIDITLDSAIISLFNIISRQRLIPENEKNKIILSSLCRWFGGHL